MARRRTSKPSKVTIRTYQVGFGDCFLLSFHYPRSIKRVLIDFGTTALPKFKRRKSMKEIAEDIAADCGSRGLDAIVATHRHRDHISGFSGSSGDIIRALKPRVVIQPWTEDPKAARDATRSTRRTRRKRLFLQRLSNMQSFADAAMQELQARNLGRLKMSATVRDQLSFLGEDNIANKEAVKNLISMGKAGRAVHAHYGSRSGLERILPGVKIHVLGPPTLEQSDAIRHQRDEDRDEFWHLQALTGLSTNGPGRLFSSRHEQGAIPLEARWFVPRLQELRGEQLLQIVRILDEEMNNTSLILLFEVGNKKLLFSGDAQIENWEYCLKTAPDHKKMCQLLKKVDFYKVGHHGSLNATPKTLWNMFERKGGKTKPSRMKSVVSTMSGKHGSSRRNTEVPRKSLEEQLKKKTDFFTSQSLRSRTNSSEDVELDV